MINFSDMIVKKAKAKATEVAMIGDSKIILSKKIIQELNIASKDIGKDSITTVGVDMGFLPDGRLFIYRNTTDVRKVSGTIDKPEIYCSDICQEILSIIDKKLKGSGTVHFSEYTWEKAEDDTSVLLVNIKNYGPVTILLESR